MTVLVLLRRVHLWVRSGVGLATASHRPTAYHRAGTGAVVVLHIANHPHVLVHPYRCYYSHHVLFLDLGPNLGPSLGPSLGFGSVLLRCCIGRRSSSPDGKENVLSLLLSNSLSHHFFHVLHLFHTMGIRDDVKRASNRRGVLLLDNDGKRCGLLALLFPGRDEAEVTEIASCFIGKGQGPRADLVWHRACLRRRVSGSNPKRVGRGESMCAG